MIDKRYEELRDKVSRGYEVTLEEFKEIVVPYTRLHREGQFVLHERVEKDKKVTKKRITEILARMDGGNYAVEMLDKEKEAALAQVTILAESLAVGNKILKRDRLNAINGVRWKESLGIELDSNEFVVLHAHKLQELLV